MMIASFTTKFCFADQTHKFMNIMNIINDVRHGIITMFARDMESSRGQEQESSCSLSHVGGWRLDDDERGLRSPALIPLV